MRPRLSTAVARTAVMAAARATVERVRLQTSSIAMPRSKETVGLSRGDDDPSPFPAGVALVGSYFIPWRLEHRPISPLDRAISSFDRKGR